MRIHIIIQTAFLNQAKCWNRILIIFIHTDKRQ